MVADDRHVDIEWDEPGAAAAPPRRRHRRVPPLRRRGARGSRAATAEEVRTTTTAGPARPSRRPRELRREPGEVAQRLEALQRLALELTDPLAREIELVPDRLERPGLALEPEAELEDPPLALRAVRRARAGCSAGGATPLPRRTGRPPRGRRRDRRARPRRPRRRSGSARRTHGRRRAPRRRAGSGALSPRRAPASSRRARAPPRDGARRAGFCWRSTTWTGTRIVRAWFATARWTDCRIHQVAYVENLNPRRQSNFSTARLSPSVPSWMRSRNGTPRPR